MNFSAKGRFYGDTNASVELEGLTLTDTVYTLPEVDWHYHENAYFTFILQGNLIEGNKKEVYNCSAGSLLFHNWQEPHYNSKPEGFTRGFHVETGQQWLNAHGLSIDGLQGSLNLNHPEIKLLMYKIFRESKTCDSVTELSLNSLVIETLSRLMLFSNPIHAGKPLWVLKVEEILHDRFADPLKLTDLATAADIHPVHLSKYFPKYFNCTLGEYIRMVRVEKALGIMSQNISLTEVALSCGFYDQSHFIRCFREMAGTAPSQYNKILQC